MESIQHYPMYPFHAGAGDITNEVYISRYIDYGNTRCLQYRLLFQSYSFSMSKVYLQNLRQIERSRSIMETGWTVSQQVF